MTVAGSSDQSDQELIDAARRGDRHAFGVLWGRHSEAGRRVARTITQTFDADDLVSEAYLKIFMAVMNGGGPTGPFRPYLFVTIRNLAVTWARRRREQALEEAENVPDPRATDASVLAALDSGLTLRAFKTLPERWQEVLWFTEVDAMSPAEVAARLGMRANSVAALAYRAREGLRQAWIQAHIDASAAGSEHQWVLSRVGKNARGGLSARNSVRFAEHLAGCPACTVIADEALDASRRFTSVLLPLAAGITGTAGLGAFLQSGSDTTATTSVATPRRRPGRRNGVQRSVWAVPTAALIVALVGSGIGYAVNSGRMKVNEVSSRPEWASSTSAPTSAPTAEAPSTPEPTPVQTPSIVPETTDSAGSDPSPASRSASASSAPVAAPTVTPSPPDTNEAVRPQVTAVDSEGGVLLPIIQGTARPGSTVTVQVGPVTVTTNTDAAGSWRTEPVNIAAGSYAATATADSMTSPEHNVTVTAPVVSLSTAAGSTTVTVRGAPATTYLVQAGTGQGMKVTTGADGVAHAAATQTRPKTVTARAVLDDRSGPTTTIAAG